MHDTPLTLTAAHPFSFVLFGASGHLATLKLYPALYTLAIKKRLPEKFAIVGYARTAMDQDAFRTLVADAIRKNMIEVNEAKLAAFLGHVHYNVGQYDSVEDFRGLQKFLQKLEGKDESVVRLAYLSIPPQLFADVLRNLCDSNIHDGKHPFRCIVEKPVGHDMKSFEEIRSELKECFRDEEIFLLDHYLGKESVRNIYYLRSANPVFERLFKHTLIQHVEVAALEPAGIEGRAGYFEHTGTLRDMFQSHLLEMCALLTMRLIEEGESFRESRQQALEQLAFLPNGTMEDTVLQGQYGPGEAKGKRVPGYTDEEGVSRDSRTNTYTAMKIFSGMPRWEGIPFFLRSGKRLTKKETRISILFTAPEIAAPGIRPNRLDIMLQGEAGMRLHLQTKLGGSEPAFRPLILEDPLVCVGDCLPEHAILLLEAINGKQQWFLRFTEVEVSWKLLDPMQTYLDKKQTPLSLYPAGSEGPKEANAWMTRHGTSWF